MICFEAQLHQTQQRLSQRAPSSLRSRKGRPSSNSSEANLERQLPTLAQQKGFEWREDDRFQGRNRYSTSVDFQNFWARISSSPSPIEHVKASDGEMKLSGFRSRARSWDFWPETEVPELPPFGRHCYSASANQPRSGTGRAVNSRALYRRGTSHSKLPLVIFRVFSFLSRGISMTSRFVPEEILTRFLFTKIPLKCLSLAQARENLDQKIRNKWISY